MRVGKVLSRLRLSLIACLAVAAFAGVLVGSASAAAPSDASGLAGSTACSTRRRPTSRIWPGAVRTYAWSSACGGLTRDAVGASDASDQRRVHLPAQRLRHQHVGLRVQRAAGELRSTGRRPCRTQASVFEDGNRICVRGTWISNKAGIVVIKLTVSYNGVILGQHDFLIGWMAINSANMIERRLRHRGSGRRAWQLGERPGHGLDPAEPGVPGRLGTPVAAGHAQRLGAVGAHDGYHRSVPR